jgi:tetratricopeptide (TPR) repeat protein
VKASLGKIIFLLILGSLGKVFAAELVAPTKAEVETMYSRAAHELNAGNYAETLRLLDELDQRQPDVAAAQNLRGVALMRMGEFGPAEKILQKARELDPDLWEARLISRKFLSWQKTGAQHANDLPRWQIVFPRKPKGPPGI